MMSTPCCPDCSPQCQMTGLAVGQHGDFGAGDQGPPYDGGLNAQSAVFWGDECCPDCPWCPICQGN